MRRLWLCLPPKTILGHGPPMITNNDVIYYFALLKPRKIPLV